MWTFVYTVLALSGVGAVLAAILVVADRVIANYGECEVVINDDKQLTVAGGQSLLEALTQENIFIPSACGGRGTCGYCKCKVLEGGGPLLPTEGPFLSEEEKKDDVRLSCQIKIRENMKIKIPQELLSVAEYRCTLEKVVDLTYDTKLFRLKLLEPTRMEYIPGQYVQLKAPVYEESDEEVYRAYSIASDPTDREAIELIIRLVPGGICTTYCFKYLKVNDEVFINGPYGEFRLSGTDAPIIMVAGGSGMAPVKCLLHQMKDTDCKRPAMYFFGGNTTKDLYLGDLMQEFEQSLRDFKFVPVVARPAEDEHWEGETRLVTEALKRSVKDASKHEAYLCGSPGMIDATIKVLTELGMPEDKIYYDKFA